MTFKRCLPENLENNLKFLIESNLLVYQQFFPIWNSSGASGIVFISPSGVIKFHQKSSLTAPLSYIETYGELVHFQGMQLFNFHFCLPFEWSLLLGKNLLPRSKFFPVRVDPISEGGCHPEKLTGSHKSCSSVKMAEKYRVVPVPLNKLISPKY